MSALKATSGPWAHEQTDADEAIFVSAGAWPYGSTICEISLKQNPREGDNHANAALIAAAPDHALICWAMCVQDATWDEWVPFDGKGEFCFAGLRYATKLDEFGCPAPTPALRAALARARGEGSPS